MGLDTDRNGVDIVAVADAPAATQTFHVERNPDDLERVRIRAPNGFFLQVRISPMFQLHIESLTT